jgi:hypothetical protein
MKRIIKMGKAGWEVKSCAHFQPTQRPKTPTTSTTTASIHLGRQQTKSPGQKQAQKGHNGREKKVQKEMKNIRRYIIERRREAMPLCGVVIAS